MITETTVTVAAQGITVDLLCWRRYGRDAMGMVPRVLAANQGLALLGPVLPIGTKVILPAMPDRARKSAAVRPITLWD